VEGYITCVSQSAHTNKCNVMLTMHRDISVQKEPTGCNVYFQFIAIINLYMFRAGLLLIYMYRIVPPDDEQ
jgi:hypothetical protein